MITKQKLQHLVNHLDMYFISGRVSHFEDIQVHIFGGKQPIQITDRYNPRTKPAIRDIDRVFELIFICKKRDFLLKAINAIVIQFAEYKQSQINDAFKGQKPPQHWMIIRDAAIHWQSRNNCLDFEPELELCGESEVLLFHVDQKTLTWAGKAYQLTKSQYRIIKYLYDKEILGKSSALRSKKIETG